MSFIGLNIAGSALDAYQTAENVTADNIANVNTTGASQQVAQITQQAPIVGSPFLFANPGNAQPGTVGQGVLVSAITRVHQDSYDALFRGATASQNYYNVEQQTLTSLQSALGEPAAGVNAAYTTFQSAVQQLAGNPTDNPSQNNLLSTAQNLVSVLNNSGQSVLSQETTTIAQATQTVNQINSIDDQIAALNGQIRASTAVGDNPNTYLDERDNLIDQLSGLLSTSTELQSSGSSLITVNGKALVNDTVAYHLAAPVVGTNANGQPTLVVGFTNDPNPANPVPVNVGGGQLGGYLDLYNNKLAPYDTSLNNFASTLVAETSRITQAGYDSTGTAGGQLFQPIVAGNPIGAGNIQVGIASAAQIPIGVASTLSGTLVQPLNAADNSVDSSASVIGNASLANAPTAQINGTLTVTDDGIAQTVNYQIGDPATGDAAVPAGTIDATTIDGFVNGFNNLHYGVTASFNTSSQSIVFTRDPANIDLIHRAAMVAAGTTTSPSFTISDSKVVGTTQPALGVAPTGLLDTLGAAGINGVNQNSTNAFGSSNSGDVNALLGFFTTSYGVPAIQTTATAVPAGPTVAGVVSATVPASTITTFHTGDVITIDAQSGGGSPQENVTVSNVNYNTNTITFTAVNAHAATFTVASAQTQTLQAYYASFVAGMGVDTQTATTGNTSQTTLASNLNQSRQSVDGINVDEQTQDLIKYQNAYSAAAHVISVIAAMLADAVNVGTGADSTF